MEIESTFYIGDAPKFLSILNLFKGDAEFRLRFNYDDGTMDLEAILLSGIVGIGIKLVPEGPEGILVQSSLLRSRPVPLIVSLETQTITKTLALMCKRPSAYMSIYGDTENVTISAYEHDDTCIAQSIIHTIARNEEEEVEFKIFATEMVYPVTHTMVGLRWKEYLPDGEVCIRHEGVARRFVFRVTDVLSTVELYLPSSLPLPDVQITMLPEVSRLFKQTVSINVKENVTVCLDTDLPVFIQVPLGAAGALRMYLGTKEDS
jgi:hypothetical protein